MVGNHSKSAKAEGSLTVTPTGGAGTKVGLSDPVVLSGNEMCIRDSISDRPAYALWRCGSRDRFQKTYRKDQCGDRTGSFRSTDDAG